MVFTDESKKRQMVGNEDSNVAVQYGNYIYATFMSCGERGTFRRLERKHCSSQLSGAKYNGEKKKKKKAWIIVSRLLRSVVQKENG